MPPGPAPPDPKAPGPVVLSSQDDYRIWLNQIEVFAKSRGVWAYVDPASRNPLTISEPPAPRVTDVRGSAKHLRDLNNEELARWILLNSNHDDTMRRYEKTRSMLGEVHMEIIHTVSRGNQKYLIGPEGPRNAILRLADEYGPGGEQTANRPQDIGSRWKQLQLNPPTAADNLDTWLGKWHFLYQEGKASGMWEMQEKRPLLAFLYAADFIAPKFAVHWDCRIEENTSVDFPRLLREFRTWKQQNPDSVSLHKAQPEEAAQQIAPEKQPTETVTEVSSSPRPASKTLKNKSKKKPFKRNPGPKDDCLCGTRHFFSDCPYVVEALRPSVWAQDPEIRANFDGRMQSSPGFKDAVQRAAENGNQKHANSSPCPVPEFKRAIVTTTLSSDRTFKSAFALKDSFLITDSANVHVCNDRSRFSNFRPADDRLKSHFTKEFRILGYGTVDLKPEPVRRGPCPLMTLRNVVYAPDFMNNVVSRDLAMDSGYRWDKVGKLVRTKDGKDTWMTVMQSEFCVVEYNSLPPEVLLELAEEPEDSDDLDEPLSPNELEDSYPMPMGNAKWVPLRAGSESDFDGMDWIDPHAPVFR